MLFIIFYAIGDFAHVHVCFSIQKAVEEPAEEALKYIRQILDEAGGCNKVLI